MIDLAVYVSGHGFGHSTRVACVLGCLLRTRPSFRLAVTTSAPEMLFREALSTPLLFRSQECDVGIVQHDPLVMDEAATAARWRDFVVGWEGRVAAEADWLRSVGARVVFGDIPPLAFTAASSAGITSVAMGNFSWDWIFAHLARREPALQDAAQWAADGYHRADLLLRLPFAGDLRAFRHIEDIPLVARRPRVGRSESRRLLAFTSRKVVLLSFGGIGFPGFDAPRLQSLPQYDFVTSQAIAGLPSNARVVDRAALAALGLDYIDLVGAADVAVTKPGYGIVTDCLGAGTRIVYTERGDFPEYPIMVEQMSRWLPCAYVSNEDLREVRIDDALADVLSRPVLPPPRLDGAEQAARRLLEIAG